MYMSGQSVYANRRHLNPNVPSLPKSSYVRYNIDFEVDKLDMNTVNANNVSVFPRGIYDAEVFPEPQYLCSYPRDTSTEYILGIDRNEHPDHFGRFMYSNNWNGYGVGIHPGRYKVSGDCCESCPTEVCQTSACNTKCGCKDICDTDPKDMAPARFYTKQCNSKGCV